MNKNLQISMYNNYTEIFFCLIILFQPYFNIYKNDKTKKKYFNKQTDIIFFTFFCILIKKIYFYNIIINNFKNSE